MYYYYIMPTAKRKVRRTYRRANQKRKLIKSKINMPLTIHSFKRRCRLGYITPTYANNGYQGFSYQFTLSDLPGYTDFVNLFDSYMITKIKLELTLPYTQAPVWDATTGPVAGQNRGVAEMVLVEDHDDATVPTSSEVGFNEIREYSKSKLYLFAKSRIAKVYVTPHVLFETYKTAITTGYSPKPYQWIDCNDYAIPHYGIRGCVKQVGLINGESLNIEAHAIYYLKMKDVR